MTSQRREPRRHGRGTGAALRTPRARAARPSSPRRRLGSTVPGEQATAKGQKGRKASGEKGSSTWRRAAEGPRGGCCAGTKRTPRMLEDARGASPGAGRPPLSPSCSVLLSAPSRLSAGPPSSTSPSSGTAFPRESRSFPLCPPPPPVSPPRSLRHHGPLRAGSFVNLSLSRRAPAPLTAPCSFQMRT